MLISRAYARARTRQSRAASLRERKTDRGYPLDCVRADGSLLAGRPLRMQVSKSELRGTHDASRTSRSFLYNKRLYNRTPQCLSLMTNGRSMSIPESDQTPSCIATRRDGSRCGTYAERGLEFCRHHAGAADVGPAAEESIAADLSFVEEPVPTYPVESVAPSQLRSRLAQDAADDYSLIRAALRDAISATKTVWGDCPGCSKRVPVQISDHQSAIRAVEKWMELGFGRTPVEKDDRVAASGRRMIAQLESMSTEDLAAIAAGEWPDCAISIASTSAGS